MLIIHSIICVKFYSSVLSKLFALTSQNFRNRCKWSFFLNVSLNSANYSVTKIFVITVKRLEPATSCVRDQDATSAPARHMWDTGSLNRTQFMLQCFISFPEFAELFEFNKSSAPFRQNFIVWIKWFNELGKRSKLEVTFLDLKILSCHETRNFVLIDSALCTTLLEHVINFRASHFNTSFHKWIWLYFPVLDLYWTSAYRNNYPTPSHSTSTLCTGIQDIHPEGTSMTLTFAIC